MDELYHNCRWCAHYDHGYCMNKNAFEFDGDIDLSSFWEEGRLAEVLEESIVVPKFESLVNALRDYGISDKRIKTLLELAKNAVEYQTEQWKERIESNIIIALNNYDFGTEGVKITDPIMFRCKEFL
jgi:hypothetical protein